MGKPLNESEVSTVIRLLGETDMTIVLIARRMGCDEMTISKINKTNNIRTVRQHEVQKAKEKKPRRSFVAPKISGSFL